MKLYSIHLLLVLLVFSQYCIGQNNNGAVTIKVKEHLVLEVNNKNINFTYYEFGTNQGSEDQNSIATVQTNCNWNFSIIAQDDYLRRTLDYGQTFETGQTLSIDKISIIQDGDANAFPRNNRLLFSTEDSFNKQIHLNWFFQIPNPNDPELQDLKSGRYAVHLIYSLTSINPIL